MMVNRHLECEEKLQEINDLCSEGKLKDSEGKTVKPTDQVFKDF